MTTRTAPDSRTLAAYHEAGHAVVAYDQGVRIHGISIVPDERRRGHIRVDTLWLDRLVPTFKSDKGARNRFTMERHVMVLLGGYCAAEKLSAGDLSEMISEGSDGQTAMNLLNIFAVNINEATKYYDWLKARTNGIINHPMRWYQLERLSQTLLDKEKLGTRKVREVLMTAEVQWQEKHK